MSQDTFTNLAEACKQAIKESIQETIWHSGTVYEADGVYYVESISERPNMRCVAEYKNGELRTEKSYRKELEKKYGTICIGGLCTDEETDMLYQIESPEHYLLQKKRDEISGMLMLTEEDSDEYVNLCGQLEDVEIKIGLLEEADLKKHQEWCKQKANERNQSKQ